MEHVEIAVSSAIKLSLKRHTEGCL